MPTTIDSQTLQSVCDQCGDAIAITIEPGQKWHEVEWRHVAAADHPPTPELRICCDATCPGCKYPEIGFAPAREEFVCSRCGHTQTDRPEA